MWKSMFQFAPDEVAKPAPSYRPLVGLGRGAMALIGMAAVMIVVVGVQSWRLYGSLTAFLAGQGPSADDVIAAATNLIGLGVATLLLGLPAIIVFLIWFWRARLNAELLGGPESQQMGRGWAIGAWFCPFVNLWYPCRIMLDIYRASSDRPRMGAVVVVWWIFTVVEYALQLWARFVGGDPVAALHTYFVLSLIQIPVALVVAALGALLIYQISTWQDSRCPLVGVGGVQEVGFGAGGA
jgi:Domain of unknown function (DUF4328)